ncbi:hypothetical protein LguiA_008214 [Lonicera macranthoides]
MESSSSSSVITPEDVLESLMNDGTIDSIRLKLINQLKANEDLKSTTIKMVEQSKVLNTPGAEKQTKRELFDSLRQELDSPTPAPTLASPAPTPAPAPAVEIPADGVLHKGKTPVLEKASKSVWELILDENGLGKEISETVEKVFCKLSGQEPPLYYPRPESQTEEKQGAESKGKEKVNETEKEKETSETTTKKRKLGEANSEGGADEDSGKVHLPSMTN